jgi:hypothetical protein
VPFQHPDVNAFINRIFRTVKEKIGWPNEVDPLPTTCWKGTYLGSTKATIDDPKTYSVTAP